jgi:renal tumor antigen
MTDGFYDFKMDIWGAGCVFFEILALYPLFQGANELDQVHKIHDVLGTPDVEVLKEFELKASHMKFEFTKKTGTGIEKLIPHASAQCKELINRMLEYKACDRITAKQVLKHPYFRNFQIEDRKSLSLENVSNISTGNEQGFSMLPTIKSNFLRKKGKNKNEASSNTLGFISKSPYSMKKSIMELKKAYAPPEKKFYKSYIN